MYKQSVSDHCNVLLVSIYLALETLPSPIVTASFHATKDTAFCLSFWLIILGSLFFWCCVFFFFFFFFFLCSLVYIVFLRFISCVVVLYVHIVKALLIITNFESHEYYLVIDS